MKKKLYVCFKVNLTNLWEKNPEDRLSENCYTRSWEFQGLSLTLSKKGYCYPVDINNYDPTKPIFVVYAIYSTEDSSGWYENSGCEIICATHDFKTADKIEKFIWGDYREYESKEIRPITDDWHHLTNIDEVMFHTYPWKGHSERLSEVRIETVKTIKE